MQLDALILNCPMCDSWYTKDTAPSSDYCEHKGNFRQLYFCNCNGKQTQLNDAHECNIITPYQEMQLQFLREQRDTLYKSIYTINRQIGDITGERE